jgi:hypothetical protein
MASTHSYSSVTFQTLVFLLSLLCFMFLFSYPTSYHFEPGFGPLSQSDFNTTLSEETPISRYNATHEVIWMEVGSLHTNDTPVKLSIRGENGILLNVTNVTSISGFSMIAARGVSGDFWLQVERLQADVSVNITLRFWGAIPPPPIDPLLLVVIYPWFLAVISILAFLYSFYRLGKMALVGPTRKVQWKFGRGPASIILLLILGVACLVPYAQGTMHGYFIPTYTQQVSYESYSLALNESSPSYSTEFTDVYSEDIYGTTFRIYNFSISDYPISVRGPDESEENVTLGKAEDEESWWLLLAVQANRSFTLTFQRVDTDAELGFSVEAKYGIYVVRSDPFAPDLLVLIGCSFCLIAIGLGLQLDWNYERENRREAVSHPVPIR